MAGGIEEIDAIIAILELKNRRAYGDPALAFKFHPIDVVARWFLRAVTEPASWTAPP